MPLHVSPHPLVAHKLAILRDKRTEPKKFRELVRELTWFLLYEAMPDLPALRGDRDAAGGDDRPADRPRVGLVPSFAAGLGMVDPMLDLIPTADVWHLGLYRDHATLEPVILQQAAAGPSGLPCARPDAGHWRLGGRELIS